MWLTFFMVGGEKKIKQTGQPIKSNGTAAGQIETSSTQNNKRRKVSAEHCETPYSKHKMKTSIKTTY